MCVLRGASVTPGHGLPLVGRGSALLPLKFLSRKVPVALGDREGHGFLQTPAAPGRRAKRMVSPE